MNQFLISEKGLKSFINAHGLFFLIGYLGIVITFVQMLFYHDHFMLDSIILGQGKDHFMDFFNHIAYCSIPDKTYFQSVHACFPAFAYIFYYFLNQLLPSNSITIFQANATSGYGYLVYLVYTASLLITFYFSIDILLDNKRQDFTFLVLLQLIFSYPFVAGVFERGNAAFLVLVLLLIALYFRQKEGFLAKESALILIACAVGFKVYPIVFVLLYLSERRYKEAVRLVIYAGLIFFLPFIFCGGVIGFYKFISNQMHVQALGGDSISLFYVISGVISYLGLPLAINNILAWSIHILLAIGAVIGIFKVQKIYLKLVLLVSIMSIFPLWSGIYTLTYFIIPLVFFLRDENYFTEINNIMDGLFGFIFTLLAFYPVISNVSSNYICTSAVYILFLVSLVLSLKERDRKDISLPI